MVRLRADIADSGALQRVVRERMARATRVKMREIGRDMVRRANTKMEQRFDLNRPASRRRHPGTTRARNALDFQIDGSEFPIVIKYRVLGGNLVRDRIVMLNWGTSGHDIVPNGNAGGNGNVLAWEEGGQWVYSKGHWHPGSHRGDGFLEEAMREAFDAL